VRRLLDTVAVAEADDGSRAQRDRPDPTTAENAGEATIYLVACVSRKRSLPTRAEALYDSPLFDKCSRLARMRGDRWFILSAKHGLLRPDEVVAPYEETLNTMSADRRRAWASAVCRQLMEVTSPGDTLVFLAGSRYREGLIPELLHRGCKVEVPMEGLTIGRQLQWLDDQARED
jgi:hypothetical protein